MTYLIIGFFTVLLFVYFFIIKKKNTISSKSEQTRKEEIDFPPKPKWKPNLSIDIDLIYKTTICNF